MTRFFVYQGSAKTLF